MNYSILYEVLLSRLLPACHRLPAQDSFIVPDNSSSRVQMLHNIKVLLHGSIPLTTKEVRRKWSYTGAYYFHQLLMTETQKGTNMWIYHLNIQNDN